MNEFKNTRFESQSETIIDRLVNVDKMSREEAMKYWFSSKTYSEIIKREITYISAMRAYTELELEAKEDPEWMRNEF